MQLAGADALDGAGDRALVRGRLRGAGDTHLADRGWVEHRKWLVCEGREAGTERRERLGRIVTRSQHRRRGQERLLPVARYGKLRQDEQRRRKR